MSTTSKQAPSFEQKLGELEAIVVWFESDQVSLSESMQQFEKGMKLAQELEKELQQTANKIEVIKQKFTKAG